MIFNEIIWDHTRSIYERLPDILCLAISFANFLIPTEKIHHFFCKFQPDIVSEIQYDNIRKNFIFVNNIIFYSYRIIRNMIDAIQLL